MKNAIVESWRFLYSIFIIFYHLQGHIYGCGFGGYIAVEFFFILSGFLLAKSIESMSDVTAPKAAGIWLSRKVRALFPHYILSWGLVFLCGIILDKASGEVIINRIITTIWEVLFLAMSPLSFDSLNNPTWYISAMLIAGYFIVYLLKKNDEVFVRILSPLILFGMYGWLFHEIKSLSITVETTPVVIIRWGNLRAFAGVTAGVLAYKLYKIILEKFTEDKRRRLWLLGNGGLIFLTICAIYIHNTRVDFYFVVFYMLIIPVLFLDDIKNKYIKKLMIYLGKLSYPMYLNHLIIENITLKYFSHISIYKVTPIYLFVIIIFSVLSNGFVEWIVRLIQKRHKLKV